MAEGSRCSQTLSNVRFGSQADSQRHTQLRPLLGVKQKSNVRFLSPKRSCASDVWYWG